ncbi:hypothetical protein CEXT_540501 [Caerostris extrusa]|uniref:Uncharacterized protein n=1 Tax=Caerostris extrusa TaxID=172846 RepID=A0AAV4XPF0_CAEEX|nr:hypothetical protein CEXT_540501 [Caerostris extrusa]
MAFPVQDNFISGSLSRKMNEWRAAVGAPSSKFPLQPRRRLQSYALNYRPHHTRLTLEFHEITTYVLHIECVNGWKCLANPHFGAGSNQHQPPSYPAIASTLDKQRRAQWRHGNDPPKSPTTSLNGAVLPLTWRHFSRWDRGTGPLFNVGVEGGGSNKRCVRDGSDRRCRLVGASFFSSGSCSISVRKERKIFVHSD